MTEAHKEVRKKIQSRNKVKEKKSYLEKANPISQQSKRKKKLSQKSRALSSV